MSLDGSPCHLELAGYFGVIATLQKQFNYLLFARTEPNGLLVHFNPLFVDFSPNCWFRRTAYIT